METNLSRALKFLTALVLVGFMIGCGGNTASDNTSPKGDGKAAPNSKAESNSSLGEGKVATDTANQPKAKKKSDLLYSILNASLIGRSISHGTDEWGDVALSQLKSLLVFYSPQHPDTKKLTAALPKPAKPDSVPKDKRVSHYALNKSMAGNDFSGSKVLVFECDLGWNGVGGLEDALKHRGHAGRT